MSSSIELKDLYNSVVSNLACRKGSVALNLESVEFIELKCSVTSNDRERSSVVSNERGSRSVVSNSKSVTFRDVEQELVGRVR